MNGSNNRYLAPITIIVAMAFVAVAPWTLRSCVTAYYDSTDPVQAAVARLRQPEVHGPVALELVRYSRSRPLRALAVSADLFRDTIPRQRVNGGTLGTAWIPEPVLSDVLHPLRRAWSGTRQRPPSGYIRFTDSGCKMELPGEIGYEVVSPIPPNAPATGWEVYLIAKGEREFLAQVDGAHTAALTRPEALERLRQGVDALKATGVSGEFFNANEEYLSIFLGAREKARDACRSLLLTFPENSGVVLLNALLLAEEQSPAEGAALMERWYGRVPSPEHNAVRANFYYATGDTERLADSLREFQTDGWSEVGPYELYIRSTALALGMHAWREGEIATGRAAVLFSLETRPGTNYPSWWRSVRAALEEVEPAQTPDDLLRLVDDHTGSHVVLDPIFMRCYEADDPAVDAYSEFFDHVFPFHSPLLTAPSLMTY